MPSKKDPEPAAEAAPATTGIPMTEKKAYPLRINAEVLAAAQRWADDELRSLNAQIEYVLRDALRKAGRLPGNIQPKRRDKTK